MIITKIMPLSSSYIITKGITVHKINHSARCSDLLQKQHVKSIGVEILHFKKINK